MSAAVVFLLFFVCLIIAIPISIALGIVSVLPGAFDPSFTASGTFVIRSMLGGIDSFPLLAVPMFVLSGMIMAKGGISKKIFDVFAFFIGKLTAGMPCAVIVTCLFYGAISGSAPATVAAVGSMTIPILVRLGYDKSFVTAIVAVAGGLGVIIPPSIPMVVYSSVASCSISALFMGGIIPGILIGGGQMLVIFYLAKKYDLPRHPKLSFKDFCGVMFRSIPGLITPILILGGVLGGFMTATESACVACIYALFLGMGVFRTIKLKDMKGILVDTLLLNSISLFALATANAMGQLLAYYNLSSYVKVFFANYANNRVVFMLMVIALYLFLGTFMDACPAIILFAPILLGTAETLGITSVQMGLVIVITLAIGQVTPPYGVCLMLGSKIADMPMQRAFKAIIPYIAISLAVVILLAFFPQIGNVFG